jgi:hypothetical protein
MIVGVDAGCMLKPEFQFIIKWLFVLSISRSTHWLLGNFELVVVIHSSAEGSEHFDNVTIPKLPPFHRQFFPS